MTLIVHLPPRFEHHHAPEDFPWVESRIVRFLSGAGSCTSGFFGWRINMGYGGNTFQGSLWGRNFQRNHQSCQNCEVWMIYKWFIQILNDLYMIYCIQILFKQIRTKNFCEPSLALVEPPRYKRPPFSHPLRIELKLSVSGQPQMCPFQSYLYILILYFYIRSIEHKASVVS